VTSIEINPQRTDHTSTASTTPWLPVTVTTDEGTESYPPDAPYDRIMPTTAVQQMRYPWITQTRPDKKTHTPWETQHHNGALASSTMNSDGTAEGRIADDMAFTRLRGGGSAPAPKASRSTSPRSAPRPNPRPYPRTAPVHPCCRAGARGRVRPGSRRGPCWVMRRVARLPDHHPGTARDRYAGSRPGVAERCR
jgi:hypothetical protein